jgi:hypothetical protein
LYDAKIFLSLIEPFFECPGGCPNRNIRYNAIFLASVALKRAGWYEKPEKVFDAATLKKNGQFRLCGKTQSKLAVSMKNYAKHTFQSDTQGAFCVENNL